MRREPGHEKVTECLLGSPAKISAVNLTEVVAKLAQEGWREDAIRGDVLIEVLEDVDFDKDLAFAAGLLRPVTMRAGLSLADRACLALAQRLGPCGNCGPKLDNAGTADYRAVHSVGESVSQPF